MDKKFSEQTTDLLQKLLGKKGLLFNILKRKENPIATQEINVHFPRLSKSKIVTIDS